MSLNNIIPYWVLELEDKQEHLSPEEFLQWLHSPEGESRLPRPVREHQIEIAERRMSRGETDPGYQSSG